MKLKYKYVWGWHTLVFLSDKDSFKTKIKNNQIVESDKEPKYFLSNWFICLDAKNWEDIDSLSKIVESNKKISKAKEELSKDVKDKIELGSLTIKQIKEKLSELNVKFHHNLWKNKLLNLLEDALKNN